MTVKSIIHLIKQALTPHKNVEKNILDRNVEHTYRIIKVQMIAFSGIISLMETNIMIRYLIIWIYFVYLIFLYLSYLGNKLVRIYI